MERKKIVMEFHKDGTVKVAPHGYPGGTCKDATRFLEEALGHVEKSEPTPEAYLAEDASIDGVKIG